MHDAPDDLVREARSALRDAADVNIAVPSDDTQFVQEAHLAVEHAICAMVEGMLFDERGRR